MKDLSARLPYDVIVDYSHNAFDVHNGNYVKHGSKCILKCYLLDVFMSPRQNEKGEYIKPYLRPMSSMTDEEERELRILWNEDLIGERSPFYIYPCYSKTLDFYNSHHFDYRGLIEKGLASVAPEGMYKTK